MMNLILHRTDLRQDCTLGVLELIPHQDSQIPVFTCATLEPKMSSSLRREERGGSSTLEPPVVTNSHPPTSGGVRGAIPPGRYRLTWQWSNHFGKNMPFLENVPRFTGIMIHPGNTAKDTKGCILVGQNPPRQGATGKILNSRLTFSQLEALLKEATESIWITIE